MKKKQWFGWIGTALLTMTLLQPIADAKTAPIVEESMYELLIDRFENGSFSNDVDVDINDPTKYSGGDLKGVVDRLQFIKEMNFTLVSIGSVFPSETYYGTKVTSYEGVEEHFGDPKELHHLIKVAQEEQFQMGIIPDFPVAKVSENHELVQDGTLQTISVQDGVATLNLADDATRQTVIQAAVHFVKEYDVAGVRLSQLGEATAEQINELIDAIKTAKDVYVFAETPSSANFDGAPLPEKMQMMRDTFVRFDADSSGLDSFNNEKENEFIQYDDLLGARFTHDLVEERMFPPTRWRLAATALFMLPGMPVVPYGTEVAVNGEKFPENHPIANFRTQMELQEFIGDLNKLRNQSETLRTGEFDILHNENGFMVFTRKSDKEKWIIAINNTTQTQPLTISQEFVGDKKRLRGLLDQDMVVQSKEDGDYRIALLRESTEIYIVDEDKGYNTLYLVATVLIYTTFFAFMIILWRRRKK